MKRLMAITLLAMCASAHAQEPRNSAKIPKFDKTLFSLELVDLGVRTFDSYTTRYDLRHKGFKEKTNFQFIAKSNFNEFAYAGVVTGLNAFTAYELKKHGHRKLALLVPSIDIAYDLPAGIHNTRIIK